MNRIFSIFLNICFFCSLSLAQDYTQLYIIGGATANGWDNNNAQKMTLVSSNTENAIFTWTGQLSASDFKFINASGTFWPCFNATSENEIVVLGQTHNLAYHTTEIDDYKFVIQNSGLYTITVDMRQLTMVVESVNLDELPENLWICGSAIPNGTAQLIKGYDGTFFLYGGSLQNGDVKIMDTPAPEPYTTYYIPYQEAIDITGNSRYVTTNDNNAAGWEVLVDDPAYKIRIDLIQKRVTAQVFLPSQKLYIVGGATEAGWDAEKAILLSNENQPIGTYVFEGELKIRNENVEPNAFKFLGQKTWDPYSIHAISENAPILTASYIGERSTVHTFPDYKWTIDEDKQGHYTITVNLLNETIEAQYNGEESSLSTPNEATISINGHDGLHIWSTNGQTIDTLHIYDLSGRLVIHERQFTDLHLPLEKGIYIISLNSITYKTIIY